MVPAVKLTHPQQILITGITGAVGGLLAARLLKDKHKIRGFSRRKPEQPLANVTYVQGDVTKNTGLDRALEGVDTAYYLVHSMEQNSPEFFEREQQSARNFRDAAQHAGIKKVIYLGGLCPPSRAKGSLSPHLASRLNVERILLDTTPASLALRASIVIGAQSRSFLMLVHLVERMRAIPLPPWSQHQTTPVDLRDALEVLAKACTAPKLSQRSLDLAGPQIVSYQELIELIAHRLCLTRPMFHLPADPAPLTKLFTAAISQEDPVFVNALMQSLTSSLLPRKTANAMEFYNCKPHTLQQSLGYALSEIERQQPLVAW